MTTESTSKMPLEAVADLLDSVETARRADADFEPAQRRLVKLLRGQPVTGQDIDLIDRVFRVMRRPTALTAFLPELFYSWKARFQEKHPDEDVFTTTDLPA